MAKTVVDNIKTDIRNMAATFSTKGMAPGCPIWVIREACDDCPDKGLCENSCSGDDKNYLEKLAVSRINIVLEKDDQFKVYIVDTEGQDYDLENLNEMFFIDRKEAIKKL